MGVDAGWDSVWIDPGMRLGECVDEGRSWSGVDGCLRRLVSHGFCARHALARVSPTCCEGGMFHVEHRVRLVGLLLGGSHLQRTRVRIPLYRIGRLRGQQRHSPTSIGSVVLHPWRLYIQSDTT